MNEQEAFNKRSDRDEGSTPKPDPTILTTEALTREIDALREVLDQRITAVTTLFDEKIVDGVRGGLALKELFTAEVASLREAMASAQGARSELLQEKFEGRDKALVAALAAADKAVEKSNLATEKRFDGVNELLGQQTAAITSLIPRAEAEVRISGLAEKVDSMQRIVDRGFSATDTREMVGAQGRSDSRANIAIAISIVMGVLTMLTMILVNAIHIAGH